MVYAAEFLDVVFRRSLCIGHVPSWYVCMYWSCIVVVCACGIDRVFLSWCVTGGGVL